MFRTLALTAVAAGAGLTLAACGGSTSAAVSPSSSAAAPSNTTTSKAATGRSVTATETEFAIALSTTKVSPGTYTFTAKNAGSITHALSITGPGGVKSSTGDISPGSSATMTVTLGAGTYDVFCPVADHKSEGMDMSFTVS